MNVWFFSIPSPQIFAKTRRSAIVIYLQGYHLQKIILKLPQKFVIQVSNKVCVLDLVQLEDDIGYIKTSYTDLSSSNWTRSKIQTLSFFASNKMELLQSQAPAKIFSRQHIVFWKLDIWLKNVDIGY